MAKNTTNPALLQLQLSAVSIVHACSSSLYMYSMYSTDCKQLTCNTYSGVLAKSTRVCIEYTAREQKYYN